MKKQERVEFKHLLYVSCLCSSGVEKLLFEKNAKSLGLQIQKYHRLLAKGFSLNDIEVEALSYQEGVDKQIIDSCSESESGVFFNYINPKSRRFRHLDVFIKSFFRAFKYLKKNKDGIVICDVLNFSISFGAVLAARLLRRNATGIITDFPEQLSDSSVFSTLVWMLIGCCSSYVVMTEQMKTKLKKDKRIMVIEGHVDCDFKTEQRLPKKDTTKICLYAGMLHRKYGIEKLVKAFIAADVDNSMLYIFGDGDYAEELQSIESKHIRHFGVVPNKEVVEYELIASLLINPRPTEEEFTKYSFPSKNMEYMVSGTPVLTTKLPGMPAEYENYVYLFEEETIDGMTQTIRQVLSKTEDELCFMGSKAQDFVMTYKNNRVQAKRVIEWLRDGYV